MVKHLRLLADAVEAIMDIMIPTATPDKNIDKNVFVSSFRFVLATTKPIRKFGIVCKTVL